jgi:tetratricopeptide (TPR) repeat protein
MERIGRYAIVRELGKGGQGRVYEAVLQGPGGFRRTVALKVLESGDALDREARIGGWLRHENLVDVFEVGHADGIAFAAMEYCPDGTLAERAPLPGRAVVEVALQVCAALQYAHDELGLVHLDLKPQNLLLHGATVKVADLGIARARGFEHDGRVRGTRGYMAPEQARGDAVDARSDVYAMGVVLHELATGVRPGASTTISLDTLLPESAVQTEVPRQTSSTTAVDEELPTAVVSVESSCPAWLAPIVARCLQPAPHDRFGSMAELAAALQDVEPGGEGLAAFLGATGRAEPEPSEEVEASFGREDEHAALLAALAVPGLVTLKGPAGIGKSHLARRAAAAWSAGPAWRCAVAEARALEDVLRVVGAALGVSVPSASRAVQVAMIGRALSGRGAGLLVLDDLGSVEGVAEAISAWRARSPELRVLVAARRPVGADAERILEVGPLEPEGAVALVRARALDRGVEIGADPALDEIVRRLDGVPLALELAAGRLGVLTTADLRDRLGLSLLRAAEGPERHSTLAGALDWSWEQLDDVERRALTWLSVFRGGFTVEAAEAVLDGPGVPRGAVLDVLDALTKHSLVSPAGGRLRLLEPVREYVAARLEDPVPVEERHGRWYGWFGTDDAIEAVQLRRDRTQLDAVSLELDNLLVAARRAISRDDGATAAATLRAAWTTIEEHGPVAPFLDLCDVVLASSSTPPGWRIRLALSAAIGWRRLGRADQARAVYDLAIREGRATGDPATGKAIAGLVSVAADQTRWEEVARLLDEAMAFARAHGQRSLERLLRSHVANLRRIQGRLEEARVEDELALAMSRADGDRRLQISVLSNLGNLERMLGQPQIARARHLEAVALAEETGDVHGLATSLGNLSAALFDSGDLPGARAVLDRLLKLARRIGLPRIEAFALSNLGSVLRSEGRLDEALEVLLQARALQEDLQNVVGRGSALVSIGLCLADLGRYEEAEASLRQALRLHGEAGMRIGEASARNGMAELALRRGRLDEAREHALAELDLRREAGHRAGELAAEALLERISRAGGP